MADEKQARHALADMQARLARSAYDALGITAGDVGPEHVRAAFLQLTKTFHPAKFARMSPEIQKLANEVFLGLRAAHDQLSRPRTPGPSKRPSGPIPVLRPPTPDPTRTTSGFRPSVGAPPASSLQPPAGGTRPIPSTPTAASGSRVIPTMPANPPRPTGQFPPQPRPPTATTTGRLPTTAGASPARRLTPSVGVPRAPTPAYGVPARPPAAPAASAVEPELVGVYDLLQKGQWEQARTTLNALIALQPRPRYRALLQYSIGREAQLSRKLDEARVDLQGALEIDPDLQLAKTALAELFTRRK